MQQAAVVAYWFSLALLAGATALYAYHFVTKRADMARIATWLTGAGFLTLTASVGLHSSTTKGTALTGPNSLVLMAWALVLVYFVFEHLAKIKLYGIALIPVSLLLLLVALARGVFSGGEQPLNPLIGSGGTVAWQVGIHVLLIVIGSAGFIIAGFASATYLVLEAQLKSRSSSKLFKRLPSLAQTDLTARRAAQFAFPAYTAALLLGVSRAIETDVNAWWADIVIVTAGIVWAVFAAYLFLRTVKGWGGKGAAHVAIGGAALVVVLRVVTQVIGTGQFHLFGQ